MLLLLIFRHDSGRSLRGSPIIAPGRGVYYGYDVNYVVYSVVDNHVDVGKEEDDCSGNLIIGENHS